MKATCKLVIRLFLYLIVYAFSLVFIKCAYSQTLTQVVKGKVYDIESQTTLPGANVVILSTNPLLGAVSDVDGNYRIEKAPLGRYNVKFTYVGYDPVIIPEVLITSGKEVVLNVGMRQTLNQISGVVVKAYTRKDKPMNPMASISAKSFTVEETRRYAGGMDDPARMVSAFAGVTVGEIQDNAIIIRGNSPKGVSWRLEGVEIPNPNHFAGGNVAGGGFVTVFSSQLLANSDFFTGAFPAEYGNALAGVFDMKLRNGNADKRESTFQAGFMGLDFASEGPFRNGGKSTYLFNYRYSSLGLLSNMGLIPSEQIPQYQDLSFKLTFPTANAGTFSVWGIGAADFNHEPEEKDSARWETSWDRINYDWSLNMGAAGITHRISLGRQSYINTSIAASGTVNTMDAKRLDDFLAPRPNWYFVDKSSRITINSFINHKFNAKHSLKYGINLSSIFYNLDLNSTVNDNPNTFQNYVKSSGNSNYTEFFVQSKYNLSGTLTLNTGVNASYFVLNGAYSIDPRMSIKWDVAPGHAITAGYGKHSQIEELKLYLVKNLVNGNVRYPNKGLDLSKSQHFILGYDWLINDNLRLKVEPYFQYLYDIPGIPDSSFSMINFKLDWSFMDTLTNCTIGRNYGIDITFERFLSNNYYYLVTASLFDSKYRGDDGVWRNTRYDKGYAVNLLFGKEFSLTRNRVLGVNARLNLMGGERYSPILFEKSNQMKQVVYNESQAFTEQNASSYYLDFTITYRNNKSRFSGVWALQLKNVLGTPFSYYDYNYRTGQVVKENYVVVVPSLSYKIEF